MKFDLATVVFEKELPLLQLQARSIDLYFEQDQIDIIRVSVNDEPSVMDKIDSSWWGKHSHKVQIGSPINVTQYRHLPGWYTQQLAKLMAVSISKNTWVCVLDAKTFWIQPFDETKFFKDNKVRHGLSDVNQTWRIGAQLAKALFPQPEIPKMINPGGVPFFMAPDYIQWFVNWCDNEHIDYRDFFMRYVQSPVYLTEFLLYSALIQYTGEFNEYYTGETATRTMNLADWQLPEFDKWYEELTTDPTVFTASIKQLAYEQLTEEQRNKWNSFLRSRGIV
jgi:hypothetical protein